jgi:hypothetical protein
MIVGTLIPVEEYLRTSFHPDRDFVEGEYSSPAAIAP